MPLASVVDCSMPLVSVVDGHFPDPEAEDVEYSPRRSIGLGHSLGRVPVAAASTTIPCHRLEREAVPDERLS